MPFQVSPGVNVTEIDLTTIVPAVSTTEGAIAGVFHWGPLEKSVLIDSEDKLAARFGKPTNHNPETFFTAANFLAYGNKLYVSRAANTTGFSNTLTLTTNGNTTITANGTAAGVSVGDVVYGTGIAEGTVVSVANNTTILLSKSALTSGESTFSFTNPNSVFSAVANTINLADTDNLALFTIKNEDDYLDKSDEFPADSEVDYIAKYPGSLGNSLKISVCDSANAFSSNIDVWGVSVSKSNAGINFVVGSNTATVWVANSGVYTPDSDAGAANGVQTHITNRLIVGDIVRIGNTEIGFQDLRVTNIANASYAAGNTTLVVSFAANYNLSTNFYANTIARNWEYYNNVERAPGQSDYVTKFGNTSANDELHVVVSDEDGKFTGVPGSILEVFQGLSRASDSKTEDGATLYYKTVINDNSNYVWWAKDRSGADTNTALSVASSTNSKPLTASFGGGQDGANENNVPINVLTKAYDRFRSTEEIDVSLILQGKARGGTYGGQLANYLIDNIAEYRKDCVVFVSPDRGDVVNNIGKDEAQDIVQFRNSLSSTSYAVLDSGYKYQYDKYNDVYRYVPLNGDIAGLAVRTDNLRDPWWSPAGFNRGQIKNIIKLAYNPQKADRDILYKSDINPVCVFPGQGTVLFGDKTILGKPSAFDRINVRRLFIVLEKAIATAAKFTLFEFNDEFTRAQFRNLVEPFLRDVQGRRGIYDFRVVCDETNNTPEVIDRNEFIGDIYIKPARSINFIQLNFVAVRTGVEFSEIVGKF
jgi:phage tail sheath protein FI